MTKAMAEMNLSTECLEKQKEVAETGYSPQETGQNSTDNSILTNHAA